MRICILEGLKLHQKAVVIALEVLDGGEFCVGDALGTDPPAEDSIVAPWQCLVPTQGKCRPVASKRTSRSIAPFLPASSVGESASQ